jgi:muramoyltetrapeptide carboxypeptidase LdcA involved in peptidoglycan recycling
MLDWADPQNQTRKRQLQPNKGWRYLQGTGCVEGHLIGGCLEVLDWLRGTEFWPELDVWQNAILFLETSEDGVPPITVVCFLRCLAAVGVLERLAGLLVGRPGGQIPPETFPHYDEAILTTIRDEYDLTALPIVTQMDFGHTEPICVLPLGVRARIDCERQQVVILENAVCAE